MKDLKNTMPLCVSAILLGALLTPLVSAQDKMIKSQFNEAASDQLSSDILHGEYIYNY